MDTIILEGWFAGIRLTPNHHYESLAPQIDTEVLQEMEERKADARARTNSAMLAQK